MGLSKQTESWIVQRRDSSSCGMELAGSCSTMCSAVRNHVVQAETFFSFLLVVVVVVGGGRVI